MALVTGRENVLALYQDAAQKKWVLPCFCTENLTTTEAILCAVAEHGDKIGIKDLPVIVAITNLYDHRAQTPNYTHTRRWDIGLQLFMKDLAILAGPGGPFANLRVMLHLDHVQFDTDHALLNWDMTQFSSIMYDASRVDFANNIRLTAEFVRKQGQNIVIEGACDEVTDATGDAHGGLTTPERAERYLNETGADLMVANLGTEHRAAAGNLTYHGDLARKIAERVKCRMVLHGASSVPGDQIRKLFDDGICKVNLWTALERDSSPQLFAAMVRNAVAVAGPQTVKALQAEGLLAPQLAVQGSASIAHYTTLYRQTIVCTEMKRIVASYLDLWLRP